jgi:formylglycine-generating enzyme required for sulfatase activity
MSERADIVPSVKPDLPAVQDFLGFAPYAQTLFDIISDDDTQTPLTIGIFGSWGSGKTSLMKMIEGRLEKLRQDRRKSKKSGSGRKYLTIWFNAWLYSRDEALWRSLILRVLAELRREVAHDPKAKDSLDEIETHLYRTVGPTSLGELSIGGNALVSGSQKEAEFKLPMTMGLGLLKEIAQAKANASDVGNAEALAGVTALMQAVDRMHTGLDRKRVEALEVFRRDFLTLVKEYVSPGVLVVFVDDLDRCLPDKAVEVLEAIKLFFDVEGCIFVLGIDREVVERGIRIKYKDYELAEEGGAPPISGARYLEKIVQIPFQLPPIDRSAMGGYVAKMAPRLLELDPRCDDVFTVGMAPNPRRVKRTLNIFLLLWRLSRNRPQLRDQIKPVRLAKMVVIQLHHPDLFNLLPRDPNRLINLEKRFREEKEREGAEGVEDERALARPTGLEAAFLSNVPLRELLTLHDLDEPDANFVGMEPAQVLEYVHLSHTAAEAWESRVSRALTLEPQLKRVPAGKFLMGNPQEKVDRMATLCEGESMGADREWLSAQTPQHELDLPTFDIGQYPVTNAEYEAFVKASEGQVSPPRHWEEGKVTPELASHPVVNVSWQDAVAYCAWLSERTGQQYRLPTEAEWEKAATWDYRTNKKRLYPWGDEWNADLCNNKESGPGTTVLVGQYSQAGGDSPCGVSDMAGNVWEWTLSKWGRDQNKPSFAYPYDGSDGREALEGTEYRVTRGGCFYDGPGWSHSSARFPYGPLDVVYYIGFRVVRVVGRGGSDGAS